jgi:hypothetical protein
MPGAIRLWLTANDWGSSVPRLLAIGGAPASGKTTLVTQLVKMCGAMDKIRKMKTLVFHMATIQRGPHKGDLLYFLGRYDAEAGEFGGTDRLSMAVITDALRFLNSLTPQCTVVFEGDRLFNDAFLGGLRTEDRLVLVLWPTPSVLAARRTARGSSNQSETFLKGRDTKYMNLIRERADVSTTRFDDEHDFDRVLGRCASFLFD